MRYPVNNFCIIEKHVIHILVPYLSFIFIIEFDTMLLTFQVLETNRAEESQSHVHRMYFMGPNTFSEPWHLPHTPPEQIKEIV